jgi:hypothetical protein
MKRLTNFVKENKPEVIEACLGFAVIISFYTLFFVAMWFGHIIGLH